MERVLLKGNLIQFIIFIIIIIMDQVDKIKLKKKSKRVNKVFLQNWPYMTIIDHDQSNAILLYLFFSSYLKFISVKL